MEITVAKSAGFCFGVQRAVDSVYKELEENSGKIYTFGPIIHNEQVVEDLNKKGIEVIDTVEQLKEIKEGTVVIRSHGVAKEIYDVLEQQKLKMVDATCPFVKKIHNIVLDESNNGKTIIIIGNDNHPEVEGIKGWVNGEVIVINKEEQIEKLSLPEQTKACIVSQTTFNHNKFKYLVEIIRKKGYDITVVNTICNATHVRQVEAQKISSKVDGMIVIGGKNSSNTQKLYDICRNECENTFYVQTVKDLNLHELKSLKSIGITAGASTPKNIIEEVRTECQK
ncbi:4-hydroxy-3-methylbut-2-enyl diphosphate reductase [Eubacterium ventriosum]|uniref:4-hydroxy-3-methylbut-2-enyl diphosphate reductase n=1 Tax=Eubacterium ventriosum TaxID=39496 RepID=A0A413S0W7_9FIRM|nr:4-hydroxy-3-methylbut-2-enyl diphosphate reductase [Eubacterium ventriosum]RHA19196.1 4-hydroxy-3-methylbut-2-enyl diphosphate reductase [Eubacterium ventriosum]RHA54852.1 4-hydroxy-3-methylbut-2-enyl diphosphate reductase [Eubacterium ventriosum]RHA77139.1 4-hydroxy-3-methylbut-2-enyl diphosphate reductase [Eubacterium ventriosum]RHB16566.1 4-hydroxy-3-methylbut-2-enyl diphosphate reductase [Eubacterium ventriosum]RHF90882.1 4-hydroxy-3-methylbut-2-enyl diphosphate reductase [Eubacterium v